MFAEDLQCPHDQMTCVFYLLEGLSTRGLGKSQLDTDLSKLKTLLRSLTLMLLSWLQGIVFLRGANLAILVRGTAAPTNFRLCKSPFRSLDQFKC